MNYTQFFQKILLEGTELPRPRESGTHEVPDDASQSMFDQDFNPESLQTDGIQKEIAKIQSVFDTKMSLLDNVDQLGPDEIDQRLEDLEEYIGNLQPYINSKEVDMTDSFSIMANIIQTDPRKKSAFDSILSAIEDYKETSRKNRDMVELASKDLQAKVGNLAKARGTSAQQPRPMEAPPGANPQF